jgi:hypothetical protein
VDYQTIFGLVVMVIVAILGILFRYWMPIDPLDDWIEFGLSAIGGVVLAVLFGGLTPFTGWKDPLTTIGWILTAAAIVFSFAKLVYAAVKQAFPDSQVTMILTQKRN